MRSPRRSFPYKKVWSPPSRDPRFSRRTPDRLRARIEAQGPVVNVVGDKRSWATRLLHNKARKTPIFAAKRAQVGSQLQKMAEVTEEAGGEKMPELKVDSPAGALPAAHHHQAAGRV